MHETFNAGYYQIAAGAILTLSIAMCVGGARLRFRPDVWGLALGLLFIFMVIAGEGAALHALLTREATPITRLLVRLALAVGLGLIALRGAFTVWQDHDEGSKQGDEIPILTRLMLGLVGAFVADSMYMALRG